MSRTIRRTNTKKRNPRFEKDYTHYLPKIWDGREQGNRGVKWIRDFPLLPLEGKEFKKAWWKYHSDNGFAVFGWEESFEKPMEETEGSRRSRYKNELSKWLKDNDYEIHLHRCKQIWDLC